MKIHLYLVIYFTIIYANPTWATTKFIFNSESEIQNLKSQLKTPVKATETVEMEVTDPLLIESKGRLPMLLVPIKADSEVKVDPPLIQDVLNKNIQEEASGILSPLLMGFTDIQKQIQNKNYKEAREQMQKLRMRFPNVAFLDFIEASVLALSGNKATAIELLEKGLRVHPDYEDGKIFLKKLKGEK